MPPGFGLSNRKDEDVVNRCARWWKGQVWGEKIRGLVLGVLSLKRTTGWEVGGYSWSKEESGVQG